MGRRARFTDEEWVAHDEGASLAEAKRSLNVPARLTALEKLAFREGYYAKREEMRNEPVVREMRQMLCGDSFEKLIRQLVEH